MSRFFRKAKVSNNPIADQYRGKIRPPVKGSSGSSSVLPPTSFYSDDDKEPTPSVPERKHSYKSVDVPIVVMLSKLKFDEEIVQWWKNYFNAWIDSGKNFEFVSADENEFNTDLVVLYAENSEAADEIKQSINSAAKQRGAARIHILEKEENDY